MMKILSFGHIPTWAGGQQTSGLANVIYQLAKHGSKVEDSQVFLAATDLFVSDKSDGQLSILGWTKTILLKYIILHPFRFFQSFKKLLELRKMYPTGESLVNQSLKRVFFDITNRKVKPDVVHLHGVEASWYLDLISVTTKVAVTFHGMTGIDENIPGYRVLYKMENDIFHSNKVDGVYFICTQLVYSFTQEYGDNGKYNRVIFNSYDTDQFYYENNEGVTLCSDNETTVQRGFTTLCTVASLSDRKGQLRVLSSLTCLPDRKRFKYFCIGGCDDSYAKRMEKFAVDNDINYTYLGKMNPDEIRKHLYQADYMIMPSSSEGFGLTFLEAIACGVPVILPKDIPIAQEHNLINERNSILLDDCTSRSIAKVLAKINGYHFDHKVVADTLAGSSWDEIAKQYINSFREL